MMERNCGERGCSQCYFRLDNAAAGLVCLDDIIFYLGRTGMMWSKQELENLALGGVRITAERVMKQLSAPENAAIFLPENFSYLWGALGVAGVQGADEAAREKIWAALVDNGALDAFDKGILGDFTRDMAAKYRDNRLRAWRGLDNFQAGAKFKKTILNDLAKTNAKLEDEVATYCLNNEKLVSSLSKHPLGGKLKTYLESLNGIHAACGLGDDIDRVYEKTAVLRRLCDMIAYGKRRLGEDEKDFLFHYLREAATDGFEAAGIGFNDVVLARLMADEALDGAAEIEAAPLLSRNQEIAEFAAGFEEEYGFYEETAAKVIKHEPGRAKVLTERCLSLMAGAAVPAKGVVFALALLNINQIKSSVRVLQELAKRGQALEMAGYLHRLLPRAKGAERLLLDILRINLQKLPCEEAFYKEYAARRSMSAARDFAEAGQFKEAAELLKFLVSGSWLAGVPALAQDFMAQANFLLAVDGSLAQDLCFLAKELNLRVYETENGPVIGTADDNPLSAARRRFEQAVLGATTFDLSGATEKFKGLEASTYEAYQNIKGALKFGRRAKEETPMTPIPEPAAEQQETSPTAVSPAVETQNAALSPVVEIVPTIDEMAENMPADEVAAGNAVIFENAAENRDMESFMGTTAKAETEIETEGTVAENVPLPDSEPAVETNENASFEEADMPLLEEDSKVETSTVQEAEANMPEIIEDMDTTTAELMPAAETAAPETKLPEIENWDDAAIGETADGKSGFMNKININNILKINPKEVDKHFDKIKQVTSAAIKRAEEQAARVKKRVEDTDIANSPSVGKIRALAKKISFFKKK